MSCPIRRAPVSVMVLEEIALEGLEGMTLPTLWNYLSFDLETTLPLASDVQNRIWNFIKRNTHQLEFYELPTDRAPIQVENRFAYKDPDFGVPLMTDPVKFPRYKYAPIEDGKIYGSCEYYKERVRIEDKEVSDLTAEATYERWGDRFVIVASQELRYSVLTPKDQAIPEDLTSVQYCFWEAIGRSRYNGETTSGPNSMLQVVKDTSLMFYFKSKLVEYGLIVSQSFTEYRGDRLALTFLLNLPQYVPSVPRCIVLLMEKIYDLVLKSPDGYITISKLREEIPSLAKKSGFRRLSLTPYYQRIFQTKKAKHRKDENGEISYMEISIKNPEEPLNQILEEVSNEEKLDDENEFKADFVDNKHSFLDMPLREEFYRAVLRHGARGASLSELSYYLSENHGLLRQVVKTLERDGLINKHAVDIGRQHTYRYVALEKTSSTEDADENDKPTVEDIIKFSEHLQIAVPSAEKYASDSALAEIETTVNDYVWKLTFRAISHTPRQVNRRNFCIQQLNEHGLLSILTLRHSLQHSERENGFQDELCSKSLHRIIMDLKKTHNLRAYEIILKFQNFNRTYYYVGHPEIGKDHPLLQSELLRLKNLLLVKKQIDDHKKKYRRRFARFGKKVLSKRIPLSKAPSKSPKFLISRYMHEFLFYIVVELNDHQHMTEIDENLLQAWTEYEPELQIHEFVQSLHAGSEVQHAYTQELSWRTFITPLPNYADKPAGWVYLPEAIDRMPLSIFNKIFTFEQNENDQLTEYLKHPIRQHYLMRQLPYDIQKLINRTHLQRICTLVLKVLHHMGLIQINDSFSKSQKDSMMLWIYFNRRTHVLDTTTSEASYAKINTERKYNELTFTFCTFDDITMYWAQVHRICIYTKLGVRVEKNNKLNSPSRKDIPFLPPVNFDDAPQFDTGEVPGDREGAAGFAAFLFSHSLRNWSRVLCTNTQPKHQSQQHAQSSRTLLRNTSSKQLRLMGMRKSRLYMTQVKRAPLHSTAIGSAITGVSTVKRYIKKKSSMRDAIDRDALNNMRTLRVFWKKEEDDFLKLARAVYVYIGASVNALGLTLVSRICRDVIRHNLGICNKTTQACRRRIHYMIRRGSHKPEVPSWVHILQTNTAIHKIYGDNFLERLKLLYPERDEFCNALTIHFIRIYSFLHQLVHNMNGDETFAGSSSLSTRFMIPNSLDEFNRLFIKRMMITSDERIMHYANPSNEHEALTMLAIAVLHSSLCSALDKTTYTAQAFEIFKKFSEEALQNAYVVARNGGLIVACKRKAVGRLPSQITSPAYALSNLYRRRLNYLSIPYSIYDTFYAFLDNVLGILSAPKSEFVEQSFTSKAPSLTNIVELKSPNACQFFLIAEGLARNLWFCKVKLPINILTVDAEKRQTLSAMDRMLDHYHCIFENAPEVEYTKQIEIENREKQVRVKFHPAHLSYKITYSPYDYISKLPVRHLHFFCALDHLGHDVEINFSTLMHKDDEHDMLRIECPFNCILKQANYINAIERIVQQKSTILKELKEMPPQKLLNMAMNGCSVKVETSNLLTLVRMLESFWREKELAYERKDLGRLPAKFKAIKSIDWHEMCCEILEFNITDLEYEKIDEYEPTLNKEDRVTRAQDVFVVNLPTLQLEKNTDYLDDSEEQTAIHNGLVVPKRLMEAEIDRDAILRKVVDESHWKYTDNTLEALKPKLNILGFTVMEQQHVEDLLRYIESYKLGVPVTELMREFPYIQFLSRALRVLSDHYLIKRVGIASMMYVHKSNIRPWVVHTFHIKRLERENVGPDGRVSLKRAAESGEEDNDIEEEANSSKRPRLASSNSADLTQDEPSTSKRIPKPVQRFEGENVEERTIEKERKRDVIAMKPHAWIRLNGTINRRVLDRWLGSVLTECVTRSGCMVEEICTKFPYLSPVEIMFLLEILRELNCIHLTEMKPAKTSIFSSYENLQENIVKDIYDPKYTYVTAHGDAITRMSIFIGNKKYSKQFL